MGTFTQAMIKKKRCRYNGKYGTIVGGYLNEYWHPYVYKAYHIKFKDGTKDTVWANKVRKVTEEEFKKERAPYKRLNKEETVLDYFINHHSRADCPF